MKKIKNKKIISILVGSIFSLFTAFGANAMFNNNMNMNMNSMNNNGFNNFNNGMNNFNGMYANNMNNNGLNNFNGMYNNMNNNGFGIDNNINTGNNMLNMNNMYNMNNNIMSNMNNMNMNMSNMFNMNNMNNNGFNNINMGNNNNMKNMSNMFNMNNMYNNGVNNINMGNNNNDDSVNKIEQIIPGINEMPYEKVIDKNNDSMKNIDIISSDLLNILKNRLAETSNDKKDEIISNDFGIDNNINIGNNILNNNIDKNKLMSYIDENIKEELKDIPNAKEDLKDKIFSCVKKKLNEKLNDSNNIDLNSDGFKNFINSINNISNKTEKKEDFNNIFNNLKNNRYSILFYINNKEIYDKIKNFDSNPFNSDSIDIIVDCLVKTEFDILGEQNKRAKFFELSLYGILCNVIRNIFENAKNSKYPFLNELNNKFNFSFYCYILSKFKENKEDATDKIDMTNYEREINKFYSDYIKINNSLTEEEKKQIKNSKILLIELISRINRIKIAPLMGDINRNLNHAKYFDEKNKKILEKYPELNCAEVE